MNKFIFYNQRQNTDFLPYFFGNLLDGICGICAKSKYNVLFFALMLGYVQKQYAQTFTAGLLLTGENCSNMVSTIATNSAGEMYMLYIGGDVVSLNQVYYLQKWSTVTNTWTAIGSFTAANMNAQIGWNIFDEDVSMAIDANNAFHIVLRGRNNVADRGPVYVYSANGTSWDFSIISSTNLQNAGELQYTLKLDASGNPHLVTRYSQVFSPTFVYKAVYYKKNGATWLSEDIVSQTGVQQNDVQRPDLEISPNGDVHITCIRETNGSGTDGSLYYYKKANGLSTWAMTQLNTGTTNNPATAQQQMELLPNGNISILNVDNTTNLNISEYIYDGTTWQNTAVTNGFFNQYSYVINSNGDRFLGYRATNLNATNNYFYATKPSGASSWTFGTIYTDASGNIAIKRSVMLNSAGKLLTGFERWHSSGVCTGAATPKTLWYAYAELPQSSGCTTPTAYAVTGGGAYCAGGTGVAVGLANSESGVSYQLQKNNANDGSPVSGTGSAISFGTKTAAGTYTVIATRTVGACTANMTGSVAITITPSVTPSVSIAANPGNTITTGTSVTFTATPVNGGTTPTYQWTKNNVNVGTNSPTYTDAGLANTDEIRVDMQGNANCATTSSYVSSNVITMTVNSGGTNCNLLQADRSGYGGYNEDMQGQTFVPTCSGQLTSISYTLETFTGARTLTIKVKAPANPVCSGTELYSATVNYNGGGSGSPFPFIVHTLTSPISVTAGTTYFLEFTGTAAKELRISSTDAYAGGIYYTTNATDGVCAPFSIVDIAFELNIVGGASCTNPTAYAVTGGGAYCAGGTGVAVGLANSEMGVSYQLQKNNANDGSPVSGTGSAISFGTKTAAGTYTVIATRTVGACTANMTGSAIVTDKTITNTGVNLLDCPISAKQTNTISNYTVPAGNNRLLVVTASDGLSNNITGVTFNGQSMTKQFQKTDNTAVDAIFTLVLGSSLSSTTGNIVATSGNTNHGAKFITANSFYNVDQTTPVDSFKQAQNTINPSVSSLTVISAVGDMVFSIFDTWKNTSPTTFHTAGSGMVVQNTDNFSFGTGNGFGIYSTALKVGANSVTTSWTTTNHEALIEIAFNINQVSSCTNPTAYAVTGGGTYCAGGAGFAVGLANSETGVTYQLQKDNVNDGSPVNGTGAAISFGTKTAAGTYTVIATRTVGACTNNMTGSVAISITATVTPSVSIAANPGNSITAGTSVTFTATPINGGTPSYQWKKNNNNVGSNSATYTDAGLVNNDVITCVMTSTANCASPTTATSTAITMTVTSACVTPTAYAVTGGGAYCAGGAGMAVGLANSESGVSYQLQKGGVNDGSPVSGTGAAISFGTKTDVATYTVIATRISGGCTQNMTGSVAITINPLPTAYAVTGGGAYCAGGTGFAVGLANSETGVSYQLQKDNVDDGSAVNGTGSAISFGTKTAAGTYTVIATKGTCTANMTGSVAITINPAPSAYAVTGGGAYCAGGAGFAVGLANSETGVSYQLQKDNVNDGSSVNGTGSAISFGTKTAAGTYTVIATKGTCTANMTGSAVITVNPVPPANAIPTVTASNNNPCAGTGITFTLTSTPPTGYTAQEYLWSKNGTPINYVNGGNGQYTINAGTTAASNDYTVQMIYTGYVCLSNSSASNIVVTRAPQATITPNGATNFCSNTPTVLSANTGMNNYVWKRGTTIAQVGGTNYTPTVTGTYNVTVTVTDAYGCTKTSSPLSITLNALPTANAGADVPVCLGQSVQIGSAAVAGNTYTWSPTTGLSNAYIANPLASPNVTRTYTVTVSNGTTSCTNNDAVVVTTSLAPITPSLTSTTSGTNVTLTCSSPGATSVNWYKHGPFLFSNKPINSSITVVASNPAKSYTVKSVAANGCFSSFSNNISARINNQKGGDAIISIENEAFQVYPNPTNGLLNVVITNESLTTGKLLLSNSLGQVVIEKEVNLSAGKAQVELDMSQFPAGVYHLSFGEYMQKIVKE